MNVWRRRPLLPPSVAVFLRPMGFDRSELKKLPRHILSLSLGFQRDECAQRSASAEIHGFAAPWLAEDDRGRGWSNLPQWDQSLMELALSWSDLAARGVAAA